jgi:DUF1707 SHOCT-like domain/Cell wall-active antibiotics response LiaF, C-terminal
VSASDSDRSLKGDSLRVSDAERDSVVEQLGDAAGEGRISLAEFSERADQAHRARTRGELVPLLADLPGPGQLVPASTATQAVAEHVPLGAIKRTGRWRLDRETTLTTTVGPLKVDLSGAEIDGSEVHLHLSAKVGSIKVWVPAEVRIEVDGGTTVGTRQIEQDSARGGGPLIRLTADTVLGTVKIYRV